MSVQTHVTHMRLVQTRHTASMGRGEHLPDLRGEAGLEEKQDEAVVGRSGCGLDSQRPGCSHVALSRGRSTASMRGANTTGSHAF